MYVQVGLVVTSEGGGVGPYFCTWKLVHANVLCMRCYACNTQQHLENEA